MSNRFLSRGSGRRAGAGGAPRRGRPWLVTTVAVLLCLVAVLVTVVMTVPVPTTLTALLTLGVDGAQEITLVLLVAGAGLALLARRRRARVAVGAAAVCAALMLVMTAVPLVTLGRTASAQGVQVSLGDYLRHGLSLGSERPKDARTLVYARVGGAALDLDYLPAHGAAPTGAGHPAVVYVHGGGWRTGGREEGYPWGRWFTDRGYAVFTIDYRLLPHADWQTGPGDVKAAVGFVRDSAARFGVDPSDITLFGESAGGHLAMMAAYTQGDPLFPPTNPHADTSVRAVINFYGTTDFDDAVTHSTAPGLIRDATRAYIGGTREQQPARWFASSPLHHVRPGLPATLSVHGRDDRLIPPSQAHLLDAALARAGVPHRSVTLPWASHLFDLTRGNLATQIAGGVIERFERQHAR